jgi:hypothetical protein
VTGHLGLIQRPDHRKQRAGLSTSNLADHWARIGVVGVLRVRLAPENNYLAGIIKQGDPAAPTSQA